MAYNKRTWKGRQGTGLNKFSINGATPVTVVNQPDSVTEQGDALSAGNLNDLEDRIYDAFDDIADGTQIVGKATADASGNVIDQTYETKADASDLKSAIQGNSQRIENLEVAVSGSLVQTNVLTDPPSMANVRTITNANEILPWAILKRVGAMAVSWNQLVSNGNFESTTGWNAWGGSIAGATGNTLEVNVTATNSYGVSISCNLGSPTVLGHKCLVSFRVKVSDYTKVKGSKLTRPFQKSVTFSDNNWMTFNAIAEVTYATGFEFQIGSTDGTLKAYFQVVNVFDLTAMNMESFTADQFRAKFPASYYPYNTGEIIPLNPSAFKVVGKNRVKSIYTNVTASAYQVTLLVEMDLKPDTTYTLSCIGANDNKFYFNENLVTGNIAGTFDGTRQSFTFTTKSVLPANEMYDGRWRLIKNQNTNTATPSFTDVQIEVGSSATTYEPYSETTIDTSFTSDYKYVNENCHDYSENVLVNGVMRREEHIVAGGDVISNANVAIDTVRTNTTRTVFVLTPSKPVAYSGSADSVPNVVMNGFQTVSQNISWTSGMISSRIEDKLVYIITAPNMTLATFLETYGGQKVLYAVAESTSLNDPIPNIPCEDGTTVTAVTPQTDLVNAIDVPSTIAYMTKISS